jgi:hypothetical protein
VITLRMPHGRRQIDYAVEAAERGGDLWAVRFGHDEGGVRLAWRAAWGVEGWRCDCPGWANRRRCKHVEVAREIRRLVMGEDRVARDEDGLRRAAAALAAPFDAAEVKYKPQSVSGNRALVICYVDARVVMDRLDDVLGVLNWQDAYVVLPDGNVTCRLSLRIGGEWITKEDVGSESEQPDEGDRRKSAFSDALKRAAVKFGVGRYLYRAAPQWMDYDPQKKRLVGTPTPPGGPQRRNAAPPPAPPRQAPAPAANTQANTQANGTHEQTPVPQKLRAADAWFAAQGLTAAPGDVIAAAVRELGGEDGYGDDIEKWGPDTYEAVKLWLEVERARLAGLKAQGQKGVKRGA